MLTGNAIKYSLAEQGLIPARYLDLEFDVDKLKAELKKEWAFTKLYTISNFSAYASLLSGILTDLRFGRLPDRSYLIGFYSSTELGNLAFAVNAIKLMYAQGMKVVPYVSCNDICKVLNLETSMQVNGDKVREYDKDTMKLIKDYNRLGGRRDSGADFVNSVADCMLRKINTSNPAESDLSRYSETTKQVIKVQDAVNNVKLTGIVKKQPIYYESAAFRYSWDEYINADMLICWIGIDSCLETESKALSALMKTRSLQGKPTICFLQISLDLYKNKSYLYEYYWSDMEDLKDNVPRFSRFTHISCYKNYSKLGKTMCGIDDNKCDSSNENTKNEFDDIDTSEDFKTTNK